MKHTLFITGAAGYVGTMLCEQFSKRDDVGRIIALDKEPMPDSLAADPKITWIQANTADTTWQRVVGDASPNIIVHTAWQIRELYHNKPLTWKWNIDGSDAIFDYAFSTPTVDRLIHFSTVASYGAFVDNTLEHRFVETEKFRKSEYLYSEEKRICEEHLEARYATRKNVHVGVSLVRPAAITGPRGRFMRIRFGLQSALSGQLKDSFAYRVVSALVSFVPVTSKWLRQFIHEDDVTNIVERLAFGPKVIGYEVFNICPPGPAVLGPDMARAVGKRMVKIHPYLIRVAFYCFWHLTRGKIPTGPGAWRGYSYPIAVDGSKVTRKLGYEYLYPSLRAFVSTEGRYEYAVPKDSQRRA